MTAAGSGSNGSEELDRSETLIEEAMKLAATMEAAGEPQVTVG